MRKSLKHGAVPSCILTTSYRLCTLKNELNSSGYNEEFCGIWSISKKVMFLFSELVYNRGTVGFLMGMSDELGVFYKILQFLVYAVLMMVFGFILS